MYVDREGFLRIEPAPTSMTDYRVDNFNSYKRPEVTLTKPLKQVDVYKRQAMSSQQQGRGVTEVRVYLDGKDITRAVETEQRDRGLDLMPGGVLVGI